jgi:hypothetical protein
MIGRRDQIEEPLKLDRQRHGRIKCLDRYGSIGSIVIHGPPDTGLRLPLDGQQRDSDRSARPISGGRRRIVLIE